MDSRHIEREDALFAGHDELDRYTDFIDRKARGQEGASDHAAAWIVLEKPPRASK